MSEENNYPYYYIADTGIDANNIDTTFFGASASALEEAIALFLKDSTGTGLKTLKFIAKSNIVSTTTTHAIDIIFNGDEVDINGVIFDATATALISEAIVLGLGIAGWPILAVSAGASILWSAIGDDVQDLTYDVLLTLDGKDMVQFFDENDEEQAGLIFPDGISTANDAIHTFISHPSSADFDLTNGYIQLDTDIFVDDTYYIKDGSVFQTIADKIGVSLQDFLSASSGDYSNDEYYAIDSNGNSYVFYSQILGELDQKLAIETTIGGVLQTINVSTVYLDTDLGTTLLWGDNLNGHNGNNLILAQDGGGYISGRSYVDDIIIGSDNADNINTNSGLLSSSDSDIVLAGGGDDIITGGYGYDHLEGGSGNDTINGEENDDYLDGGSGNDILEGGSGTDTYNFSDLSNIGQDTIIDSDNNGKIMLEGIELSATAKSAIDENNNILENTWIIEHNNKQYYLTRVNQYSASDNSNSIL